MPDLHCSSLSLSDFQPFSHPAFSFVDQAAQSNQSAESLQDLTTLDTYESPYPSIEAINKPISHEEVTSFCPYSSACELGLWDMGDFGNPGPSQPSARHTLSVEQVLSPSDERIPSEDQGLDPDEDFQNMIASMRARRKVAQYSGGSQQPGPLVYRVPRMRPMASREGNNLQYTPGSTVSSTMPRILILLCQV